MRDRFFEATHCQRCHKPLGGMRTMSWFTNETICMECDQKEMQLKRRMRALGMDPDDYEGCGIPKLS